MLTKKQIKTYVNSAFAKCPYCGSDNITGGFTEIDADVASQRIVREACNAQWFDLYKLVGIEEINA